MSNNTKWKPSTEVAEWLRSTFSYDERTGVISKNGLPVGTRRGEGYVQVSVSCAALGLERHVLAHRLAWLLHHGEWPPNEVDHINRDRSDNRLSNLRLATHAENMRNQSKRANCSSSHKGVSWHRTEECWVAYIRVDGRLKGLGRFKSEEEAAAAYRLAAASVFGEFACLDVCGE